MSDISQLESDLLASIDTAGDEAALEAIRVSALGKKGSVSELLKTLGVMSPDARKAQGPVSTALRDKVADATAAKKTALGETALNPSRAGARIEVTSPPRPQ